MDEGGEGRGGEGRGGEGRKGEERGGEGRGVYTTKMSSHLSDGTSHIVLVF